jgi:hypothetical protein
VTPSGIEPATFWLLVQCLNQLLHCIHTTFIQHYILSQATFSNDYGKPAASDLLITHYLKTAVRSFIWNIVGFVVTQYVIAKALKQVKNPIKKMTCTQVFEIKDWKWRFKSHPFLCHDTCASLYHEWLTADVVSTKECLNPQEPCGCYDVHCCSGPLLCTVTVF